MVARSYLKSTLESYSELKAIMHNKPNLSLTFVRRGQSYATPLLAKLTHRFTCTFLGRPALAVWHSALHNIFGELASISCSPRPINYVWPRITVWWVVLLCHQVNIVTTWCTVLLVLSGTTMSHFVLIYK